MKQTFLIINAKEQFRINWKHLYSPKNYHLILITSRFFVDTFRLDKEENYFKEIIVLEDIKAFNVKNLSLIIKEIVTRCSDHILLATHEECMLEILAKLREKLSLPGDRIENIIQFRDKVITKKLLSSHNIRTPKFATKGF